MLLLCPSQMASAAFSWTEFLQFPDCTLFRTNMADEQMHKIPMNILISDFQPGFCYLPSYATAKKNEVANTRTYGCLSGWLEVLFFVLYLCYDYFQ